jgi:predicted DNA-binding antitoxin AbrB/MazE fold protein
MTLTIKATYENGVLKLKEPLTLTNGTEVEVTLTTPGEQTDPLAGLIGICSSGRTDGAANHDKYLYGEKRP